MPTIDDMISRTAKGYRARSEAPADAMWARIEADVADAIRKPEPRIRRRLPWLAAGVGIAAALVIGVAIGRRSANPEAGAGQIAAAAISASQADSIRDATIRAVTLSHFAQTEVFLTEVRADLKTGRHDPQRDERSRELLARTRLIMASDARRTPAVEQLLQDLELVLAGIAALPDSGAVKTDSRLLDEQIRVGSVLPRIRTILPSPQAISGS